VAARAVVGGQRHCKRSRPASKTQVPSSTLVDRGDGDQPGRQRRQHVSGRSHSRFPHREGADQSCDRDWRRRGTSPIGHGLDGKLVFEFKRWALSGRSPGVQLTSVVDSRLRGACNASRLPRLWLVKTGTLLRLTSVSSRLRDVVCLPRRPTTSISPTDKPLPPPPPICCRQLPQSTGASSPAANVPRSYPLTTYVSLPPPSVYNIYLPADGPRPPPPPT